jgi:hypothetical protein
MVPRFVSQKYCEFLVLSFQIIVQTFILVMNRFRHVYLGFYSEQFLGASGEDFDPCENDFIRITQVDLRLQFCSFVLMGIYFSVANVRSKFNWLLPATMSAVTFLNVFLTPPEASKYGRKDFSHHFTQFLFITVAGIFLWGGDHFRERTARRLWLAQRQVAGHSAMLQRLLRLEFPCVVHVVEEQIVTTDDFISVFGPDVAYLDDLQTSHQVESSMTGLSGFVTEAKRLGTPVKRRFEFISGGDANRIDCTVCATLTGFSDEILLGFVVHDSRTIIPRSQLQDLYSNNGSSRGSADLRGVLHGDEDLDQREDSSLPSRKSQVTFSDGSSSGRSRLSSRSALGKWKVRPTQVQHVDSSATRSSLNGHFAVICATQVSIRFKNFNSEEAKCFRKGNEREVSYLSNCQHPAILLFMGTVKFADGHALIMEAYACSLATLLEEGPVSIPNAVRMIAHISSAVAYLHDRGICHTAINSENIVLMQRVEVDPVAKIANMSQFRRGVHGGLQRGATIEEVQLEFKDVVDLATLFITLMTGSFVVETIEESPPLRHLQASQPGLASIIKSAMCGDHLSALQFAKGIARVEGKIRSVAKLPEIPALPELPSNQGSDLSDESFPGSMAAQVNTYRNSDQVRQLYTL